MFRLILWLYWAWSWKRKAHPTLFPFVGPFSFSPGECEVALVYQMITTQPHNAVSLKIYRRLVKDNWHIYRQNISLWQGSCNNEKFFSKTVSPRSCLPGSSECGSGGVIAMETSDIRWQKRGAYGAPLKAGAAPPRLNCCNWSVNSTGWGAKEIPCSFFFPFLYLFPPQVTRAQLIFPRVYRGEKKLVATNGNTAVER